MSQPPKGPGPGGEPEDRPWPPPGESTGPEQPYGRQETPYGRQQAYGQQPYGQPQPPYGRQPGHGTAGFYIDPAAGLAGRWARLGAAIVDHIIIGIVVTLIALPFVNWNRRTGESMFDGGLWPTDGLIAIGLGFLYYAFQHARWGQTLGKRLLKIRVVRAEDGDAIGTGRAVGRAAVYPALASVCGCFGLIDVLWILFDERRQCLHDKAARTVVTKVDPNARDPYATR